MKAVKLGSNVLWPEPSSRVVSGHFVHCCFPLREYLQGLDFGSDAGVIPAM